MRYNFAEIFADKIIKEFMGDVKLKMVDPPLSDSEIPNEFMIEKKFMIVDEYFKNEKCTLPIMLKKIAGESECTHR